MPYSYEFPKADITVDCVLFGFNPEEGRLEVVLIRRGEDPFRGQWALPGGFIEFLKGETAYEAAKREMLEETGITVDYLEQLQTFDAPDRDPRGRVFSVAHYALVRSKDHTAKSGSDAMEATWVPARSALKLPRMAFDHLLILQKAVTRLQAKVRYFPVGFNLLPKKFTLSQLQKLYEAILFRELDKRNFRKRLHSLNEKTMLGTDPKTRLLVVVGVDDSERSGPPANLFRFNKTAYDRLIRDGFNFEI